MGVWTPLWDPSTIERVSDVLLILLGAALAFLGGIVQQWIEARRAERQAIFLHRAIQQDEALVALAASARALHVALGRLTVSLSDDSLVTGGDETRVQVLREELLTRDRDEVRRLAKQFDTAWDERHVRLFIPPVELARHRLVLDVWSLEGRREDPGWEAELAAAAEQSVDDFISVSESALRSPKPGKARPPTRISTALRRVLQRVRRMRREGA
jgi:hypothetical protein